MLIRIICSSSRWILAVVLFVLICMFQVYIFATQFNLIYVSKQDNTLHQANVIIESLESKQKWNELREWIYDLVSDQQSPTATQKFIDRLESKLQHPRYGTHRPRIEYEQLRRRVLQNNQELWSFFSSELNEIKKLVSIDKPELIDKITNAIELGAEHKRSLFSDMDRMRLIDGYEEWRHAEAKSLSNLVQRRLHRLQNPKDCKKARKLICRLNMKCGYGCGIHHIIECFILAYATERTLILQSKSWKYHKSGWEDIFLPVSETCMNIEPTDLRASKYPGNNDTQVLDLPMGTLITWPQSLPLAIPNDLAPRLMRLHGDPSVWWIGQFLKYLQRPTGATRRMLETGMEKLGFKKPIVGVHIRRTDKIGTEASFHSIEEYMIYVEDYFLQLEIIGTNIERRVYLASDEETVIHEARKKYPTYEIIGNPDIARMAAVSTRYTDSSLNGIILDIHMLSLCDYLVCTLSSQVCRIAYETMQTMYPDASNRVKSIDSVYFYAYYGTHHREAVLPHNPRHHDEIYLQPGDLIDIVSNNWNGHSYGLNTRTNQSGLFPLFKVNKKVIAVETPVFANIK